LRARDKKEEKERRAETRSDDGWSLEFQRAGNHAEESVYRRCAIFVCKSAKSVRARADDDDDSNNRDYHWNFDQINGILLTSMTQSITLELIVRWEKGKAEEVYSDLILNTM